MGIQLSTWLVVLLVIAVPTLFTRPMLAEGRMPARTYVAGINVSGKDVDQAERLVQDKLAGLGGQEYTIVLDGTSHVFTATDIGLTFDLPAEVSQIASAGVGGRYDIVVRINPVQFQSHLDRLSASLTNPAANASVTIEGSKAVVTPGRSGSVIDVEAYRAALLERAQDSDRHIELTVSDSHPHITTHEAEVTAANINNMLAQPVTLQAGELHWTIPVDTLAEAVVIAPGNNGDLVLVWDLDPIHPHIVGVIEQIESTPRSDSWVEDLGHKKQLVAEQGSMVVDRQQLIEELHQTLTAGRHLVTVPVAITPADKSSEDVMAELGITDVIAIGTSVYEGSGPGRAHNVETASFYVNRTLVAPGGVYSFNRSVGSLFIGDYMSAGSFIGGPAEQSLAGGVCQVSTTVFRAALNSGFPIVERWPHWYRTIYYEMGGWDPGYEAAIAQDEHAPFAGSDLQFRNPTNSWLLITAEAGDGKLKIEIHGSETGYKVTFSETQVRIAHPAPATVTVMIDDQLPPGTLTRQEALDGLAASFTRYVYDRNGKLIWEDTWSTTYLPTETIIRASPDMEREAKAAAEQ